LLLQNGPTLTLDFDVLSSAAQLNQGQASLAALQDECPEGSQKTTELRKQPLLGQYCLFIRKYEFTAEIEDDEGLPLWSVAAIAGGGLAFVILGGYWACQKKKIVDVPTPRRSSRSRSAGSTVIEASRARATAGVV
jgi:hypothetical protein